MNKREWMLTTASAAFANAKTVNLDDLSMAYDAICAASPGTPQEGAWVEHDGDVSKAPVEDAEVVVEFRGGHTQDGHGGDFAWDHDGEYEDIVRWRYA